MRKPLTRGRGSGERAGTGASCRQPGPGSALPGWPRSSRMSAWLKLDTGQVIMTVSCWRKFVEQTTSATCVPITFFVRF